MDWLCLEAEVRRDFWDKAVRGYTGVALAPLLGISSATLSNYEAGRHSPTPYHFSRITQILYFKPEFFRCELVRTSSSQVSFARSRSSRNQILWRRAEHRRVWVRDVVRYLAGYLRLPECDVPAPEADCDWRQASFDAIESLALMARSEWNLSNGPISNVTLLCEQHGVIVGMFPLGSESLDAFSVWDQTDGRPYLMLGEDGQSAFRTRFNVCHELGHLVMHRYVTAADLNDRRSFNLIEQQANRFSMAFLIPAENFRNEIHLPTLDAHRVLKPRWKASVKLMIQRTEDLGLADDDYVRRLHINYNRRDWNDQEPYDDEVAVETPIMLRRAFEALIARKVVDSNQIQSALPFNRDELEQLVRLPAGYLDIFQEENDVWGFLGDLTSDFPGPEDG